MRARTAGWVAGGIAAASLALMAAALVLAYADRHRLPASLTNWDFSDVLASVVNMSIPVLGFVLASRRPANRIGWLSLAAGLLLALSRFGSAYGVHGLVVAPGSLPAARAGMWLSNWIFALPIAAIAFLFLLFPTGRLRSRRWLPAGWFMGIAFGLGTLAVLVGATRSWSHPFAAFSQAVTQPVLVVLLILLPAALLVSVTAVVVRFALSVGEERLQLKWFAAAAVLVVAAFIIVIRTSSVAGNVALNLTLLCLDAAIAIAVLKYRLYEIDIVISKAVLYGSLAVFITAVYVALVVGVGTLVGDRRSALLAALAAAAVALAFQPPASGRGGWPTASCTAGGPPRTRCCRTSPGGSVARMPTRMCCRRWRRSWRPGPAPSGSWCGCGWTTSSAPGHLPTASCARRIGQTAPQVWLRCPSSARRCRHCRTPT